RMEHLIGTLRLEMPTSVSTVQSMAQSIAQAPPTLHSQAGLGIDVQAAATALVASPTLAGSVVFCIDRARENFRSLRDQVPSELWEQINQLHLRLRQSDFTATMEQDPFQTLDFIRVSCQSLTGVISTSMAQGEGYRFLVLGTTLERALMTCRLISVRYPELDGSSYDEMALTLRSVSALEAYQKASRSSPLAADVARFLLLNDSFPRSVLYCLRDCEQHLSALAPEGKAPPLRHLGQLRSELEYGDLHTLLAGLPALLTKIEAGVRGVADDLSHYFFRNAETLDLHSQAICPGVSAETNIPAAPSNKTKNTDNPTTQHPQP
ncbi:MAG: alpha-E domain-containing protein, partial [bacterium]|nr:alpha-E domain-containing protein [bacterium]